MRARGSRPSGNGQPDMVRSRFLRDAPATAVLAVVYFVAGKLGLKLALVHASATAVWPCTGIALAAILFLGYRLWPGIWLGAFALNFMTAGSVITSIAVATGNTLEGVLGAYLISRYAHGKDAFGRVQDTFKFAFLAGMLSTAVSATFGVTALFARWLRILGQLRAHLVYVVAGRCGERGSRDAIVDSLDLRPPHPLELGPVFRIRCLDAWHFPRGPDRVWWVFAFASLLTIRWNI